MTSALVIRVSPWKTTAGTLVDMVGVRRRGCQRVRTAREAADDRQAEAGASEMPLDPLYRGILHDVVPIKPGQLLNLVELRDHGSCDTQKHDRSACAERRSRSPAMASPTPASCAGATPAR